MTAVEKLKVLKNHEWQLKEDLQTYVCVTCGRQYRGKDMSKLRHRPGCEYAALIKEIQASIA